MDCAFALSKLYCAIGRVHQFWNIFWQFQSQKIYGKLTPETNADPNMNYNMILDILTESMKKHFLIKTVKYNKRKHKRTNNNNITSCINK